MNGHRYTIILYQENSDLHRSQLLYTFKSNWQLRCYTKSMHAKTWKACFSHSTTATKLQPKNPVSYVQQLQMKPSPTKN